MIATSSTASSSSAIHTPEFDFQKDPRLVRAAVKSLGIRFPVMLDNDRKYWKA